ncbi:unnamed protein product [Kluyveromyces dobzhanskii CBS 2104]|uniref:Maintenance of telomere capping protein 6 n=1 Tax=Kluyveromyces dobzhanskii CBS 2104 TaxID=1427455 RepID=A0A0A8L6Y6_9SACH|nr:unnamed protein product [Kluyveromyces dobzhanskii CBS 2104]
MLLSYLYLVSLWTLRGLVQAQEWPSYSDEMIYAIRSQRDLMVNVSIDQVPLPGIALKHTLLQNSATNETESLQTVLALLNHGIQAFKLDLRFDTSTEEWVLHGTNTRFAEVLGIFNKFIVGTNTNLDANLLTVLLQFDNETLSNSDKVKNTNFTAVIHGALNTGYVYSLADLAHDRAQNYTLSIDGYSDTGWVGLSRFLFDVKRRVVFGFMNGDDIFSDEDRNSLVFPSETFHYVTDSSTVSCPLDTVDSIMHVSELQWRFLEGNFGYDDFLPYLECGYSLVLTDPIDILHIADDPMFLREISSLLLWSWNSTDPTDRLPSSEEETQSEANSQYIAYRCGAFNFNKNDDLDPFKIANCYSNLPYLCRYGDRAYIWNVSQDSGTFFETDDDVCPTGYKFGIPRTPLQQRSLRLYLQDAGVSKLDFWIDINSISVSNCWISGGPYAACSYQKYGSRRNYIAMTVPTSSIALVLLLVIFYFNWVHVPIQDNRNNWKRILNAYSKEELEGVPS